MKNRFELTFVYRGKIVYKNRYNTLKEAEERKAKFIKLKNFTKDDDNFIEIYEHKTARELEESTFHCQMYRLACTEAYRRGMKNPDMADIFELMSEIIARANEKEIPV